MKTNFKTNNLYLIAKDIQDKETDREEIEKTDLTEIFWHEIESMVKNKEIILINITGKPRTGKSTTAISIGIDIHKLMRKHQRTNEKKFSLKNIARDNQEASVKTRDEKFEKTVLVIDEENALEKGGENVTVEEREKEYKSNVMAGRYIHQIQCVPKGVIDQNADILLSVISLDRTNYQTYCLLSYRFYENDQEHTITIGNIKIDTYHVIKNWINNVEETYYKPEKTKKDKEKIKEWEEKDFYIKYVVRKYKKMELLTKHHVRRPRMLPLAGITLKIIEILKRTTKRKPINKDRIRNFVKYNMKKENIPMSLVGEEVITREIAGILQSYKDVYEDTTRLNKTIKEYNKQKNADTEYNKEEATQDLISSKEILDSQIEELKELKKLNEEYNKELEE